MITEYIKKSIAKARFEKLDDGTYFATVPGIKGPWGNAKTRVGAKKELQEVLEEWLLLSMRDHRQVKGLGLPSSFFARTHA